MTVTTEAATLNASVDIRFTAAGTPLAVRYDGRIWVVAEEPVRWFTRDSWWETRRNVPVGVGNVVDIEHWRVQARTSTTTALRTFTLRREPLAHTWALVSIADDS